MAEYTIYTLNEPNTDIVRYVGLTYDLKNRIRQHLKCYKKYRVNSWIKHLKKDGYLPSVKVIEDNIQTLDEAKKKEIDFIALFKSCGARLTNLTNGGQGSRGYKLTDAQKQVLSIKCSGYKHTPEALRKISEASTRTQTGVKKKPESVAKTAASLKGKPSWNKGKKWSDEQKKTLSDARKKGIENGTIKIWNKGLKTKNK